MLEAHLRAAVPLLDDKRWRRAKAAAAARGYADVTGAYARQIVYMYEWLVHLGLFDDVEISEIIAQWGKTVPMGRTDTVAVLTVADGRYVTWTKFDAWWDIQASAVVDELVAPAVTMIACNAIALWYAKEAKLTALMGGTDGPGTSQPDGV